jgi:hypothetical protein
MIDLEKLNKELEKFTLESVLDDKEKLDKLFKLLSIKQALAQIDQLKAQTELFESMANMNNNIDTSALGELMKNNSIQDIMDKFTNK